MSRQDEAPLHGLRVLDFGRVLAGPHCSLLLASLGAEVIKIERPGRGDDVRGHDYLYPDGSSGYFMQQNWGKKSVTVNFKSLAGLEFIKRLVASSDVVVENFRPGVMEGLGLGWETLRQINPALVMASITAFGQDGPDADRAGYGPIAEARAGITDMTGDPKGPPMPSVVPVADMLGASHAFGGIAAALYAREKTGVGAYVDISLMDCMIEMHDWPIQLYLGSDGRQRPTRRGHFDRSVVPWGYFEGKDGWMCIIASNDAFWNKLLNVMGRSDLLEDERFSSIRARSENNAVVYEIIGRWVGSFETVDEAVEVLKAADIPADKVQSIDEVVQDPQVLARNMVTDVDHPNLGPIKVVNTAIRVDGFGGLSGAPPALGEDGPSIAQELGYADETEFLYEAGVL